MSKYPLRSQNELAESQPKIVVIPAVGAIYSTLLFPKP
jgi:hypothetical protein